MWPKDYDQYPPQIISSPNKQRIFMDVKDRQKCRSRASRPFTTMFMDSLISVLKGFTILKYKLW